MPIQIFLISNQVFISFIHMVKWLCSIVGRESLPAIHGEIFPTPFSFSEINKEMSAKDCRPTLAFVNKFLFLYNYLIDRLTLE